MKEIKLTQGKVALVDDEDYEWLKLRKWCAYKSRNIFYASSNNVSMHSLLIDCPKGKHIDHVDHDGLNNQRNNLRIVTHRQNQQNQNTKKSSQYPGVYWSNKMSRWAAQIKINKKQIALGTYHNEIDAFRAYYDAVLSIGGEMLDFPYPIKI